MTQMNRFRVKFMTQLESGVGIAESESAINVSFDLWTSSNSLAFMAVVILLYR